ncbi:MAG: GNAT family protein [Planctomycetota bacterium]|nr:GNAT family protein [Planctomycetota bacterium]
MPPDARDRSQEPPLAPQRPQGAAQDDHAERPVGVKLLKQLAAQSRIVLRHPHPADQRAYCTLRDASFPFLAPWEPTNPQRPRDPPLPSDEAFRRLLATSNLESSQRFLIRHAGNNAILGQFSINQISRGSASGCAVGYWIGQPFARQGFMSAALASGVVHATRNLGLHRVEANIIPANARSIGLVRKLGFRHEGLAKRFLHIGGSWQDHERWALTAEELSENELSEKEGIEEKECWD